MKQQQTTKTFKIKVDNDNQAPSSVYLDSLKNSPDPVNRRINFGADGPSESSNLAQNDQKPTFTSPRNVNNLYMPNKLSASQSAISLHYPKVRSLKELNEYQQSTTTVSNRAKNPKQSAKSKKENIAGVKVLPSIYISAKVPQKAANQTSSRASLLLEEQTELK